MTVMSQQLPLFARKVREQMSGSRDKLITSGALTTPETALAATMAGNDARGRGKTITPTHIGPTQTHCHCVTFPTHKETLCRVVNTIRRY